MGLGLGAGLDREGHQAAAQQLGGAQGGVPALPGHREQPVAEQAEAAAQLELLQPLLVAVAQPEAEGGAQPRRAHDAAYHHLLRPRLGLALGVALGVGVGLGLRLG